MTSLDAYVDQVCSRLRVNPAEADDIREELNGHLKELAEELSAGGMDQREAAACALSAFGEAARIHDCLDRVHDGDPWWLVRLKGSGLGMLIGALLTAVVPVGGHLEFIAHLFPLPSSVDASRALILLNALAAGGLIGLLAAGGRALLAGWTLGCLVWLGEYVVHWVISVGGGSAVADGGLGLMNSVLLAPLLGGAFGAAVGLGTAAALSAVSRIRPQIQ